MGPRGRRIAAPKGLATRPTGDRVREAAFNLIGPVDDARVLDLFAGSGAMGIEALSRGAASVTFVESDRAACRTIAENLERLRLTGARVTCADAVWELRRESRTYDLVLVDPPSAVVAHTEALAMLLEHPAHDTRALVHAGVPDGPTRPPLRSPVRIEGGKIMASGSSFHTVPEANATFAGVLQAGVSDLPALAGVKHRSLFVLEDVYVHYVEMDVDQPPSTAALFAQPVSVEDGALVLPQRPGWGVDVDETAVRANPPTLAAAPRGFTIEAPRA